MKKYYGPIFYLCMGILFTFPLNAEEAPTTDPLAEQLTYFAELAGEMVEPEDRALVETGAASYPEGTEPPVYAAGGDGMMTLTVPSKAAAYYVAGVEAFFQNNKLVMTWCFLEAARRNPNDALFLNNTAFALFQYGLYYESKQLLLRARELAPEFNAVDINLGFACSQMGDYAQAGNYYLAAWMRHPTNQDYLNLVSQTFANIPGNDQLTWVLQELSTQMEETSAPASAPLRPRKSCSSCDTDKPDATQPAPPRETSAVYREALDMINEELEQASLRISNYYASALHPQVVAAQENYRACYSAGWNNYIDCREETPLLDCHCIHNPYMENCAFTRDRTIYNIGVAILALEHGEMGMALSNSYAIIDRASLLLTDSEYASLLRYIEPFYQQQMASPIESLAGDLRLLREDEANVAASVTSDCSLGAFEEWVFNHGFTFSVEPSFCLAIICFSYDILSEDIGVTASYIVSGKLTQNAVTGATGAQVGIGGEFGAGFATLGGGIYLKSTETQMGVEPKLGLGPFEIGYFMGLERVQ